MDGMNILKNIIPSRLRNKVYGYWALAGVAIGGTQVGFEAAGVDQPKAVIVVLAVYAYLGIALNLTAKANPSPEDSDLTYKISGTFEDPEDFGVTTDLSFR